MNKTIIMLLLAGLMAGLSQVVMASDHGRQAIHASAEQVQPLMPGMKAPAFTVQTVTGESFTFDPENVEKPVALSFFRGGWCPYCNMHLFEMQKAEAQLKEMGFEVWFVSMDKPSLLVESLDQPDIGYTLFSDTQLEASRGFGIAFKMDDEMVKRYQGHGVDLEEKSGENHHVLPVPSTFIIGTDGVISFSYSNPLYAVRLSPSVLLAAAESLAGGADQRLIEERKRQRANRD